jgi:hypothetical protein
MLEKIQRDIEEIKSTMKLFILQSRKEIAQELNKEMNSPQKKLAYTLTDGNHGAYDIAQTIKVSITTIHRWWRDWERSGLLTRTERNGKSVLQKRFSLEEIGIEVPDISSIQSSENEIREIPNREKLQSILRDSNMFKDNAALREFAERVFDMKIPTNTTEDLIDRIADLFLSSPKIKQLMFMQALRQQAECTGSNFKDYFEFWEKHIKSEI